MKNVVSFLSIIFLATVGSDFWQLAEAQVANETIVSIKPIEAQKMIHQNKAVLVDVRERTEIIKGMADEAQWMPLSRMENDDLMYIDFVNRLPKDKIIILYCASGKRAQKAQKKLENRGFQTLNMGGYTDWVQAKLPIKKKRS